MRLLAAIPCIPRFFLLSFPLLLSQPALAEQPFVVSGLGGLAAEVVKGKLIPEFEQKHGVRITYYPENSAETLQRLRSDKANGRSTDVAFMDDSLMDQAVDEKLCAKIESYQADQFDQSAHFPETRASGIGIVALGLMYNKKAFTEHGWPTPTSWLDLADPKFAGRVSMASPKNGYGMTTLLALAHANGGINDAGIDAAFSMIKSKIAPLTPAFANTPAKLMEMFSTGQIVMVPWGSARAQQFAAESGLPVDIAYPRDGIPTVLVAVCPVQASPRHALAQKFVELVLSARAQGLFANDAGLAPLRKDVKVNNAEFLPVGKRMATPIAIDQKYVVSQRSVWNKRWTAEIGPLD